MEDRINTEAMSLMSESDPPTTGVAESCYVLQNLATYDSDGRRGFLGGDGNGVSVWLRSSVGAAVTRRAKSKSIGGGKAKTTRREGFWKGGPSRNRSTQLGRKGAKEANQR